MTALDLKKFEQLKATGQLPSPQGAALAIVHLAQRDDTSLVDLAQAIRPDPAFVGRLIKAANSARSGPHRPVVAIQDALAVLGMPTVRTLALAFSLISAYRDGRCKSFDYRRFWAHSLVAAVALQALCVRTRAVPPEEAFCVGLLAGIGSLAMATLFPEEYARILGVAHAHGDADLPELERQAFAMTHADLTAAMLGDWGLPRIFADVILHHEAPEQAPFAEASRRYVLLWSLVLARRLAAACLVSEEQRRAMMPRLLALAGRLAMSPADFATLSNGVVREWQEWSGLLDVSANALPAFETLLAPPEASTGAGAEGLRILVVDDDATIRTVLKALLAKAGHQVAEAADGRQALDMAMALQPQLMIVDWLMPEMDGIRLTQALRQTKVGRGIYVILLTSMEEEDKLIAAFESGVDDFMSKPLRPRVLEAHLRAGQRVIRLQEEVERDREEIRRYAAELAVTNRKLEEAAMTDFLTGFANRRYAMERMDQEWAASTRSGRSLGCLVVDLDQFKQVNDTLGHDAGDLVLRQVALALKGGLRANDVVARTGGDEFLVICPDTGLPAALACAERVRHSVAEARVAIGGTELRPSVSIGVAVRDATMDTAVMLIKCADQGLYLAKDRGRNCVGCAQPQD
jgi:diguanylate cyclase (GGDEF)-like protein